LESATARSIASLVGSGGGLCDLSVKSSDRASCGRNVGVRERVCRSRSVPSLIRAEEGRSSSVLVRPAAIPAQSPEMGRPEENSGEAERGVRVPGKS
jgi:hypothetical protein